MPYVHYKRLELILPHLNQTLRKYNIDTPNRIAHFLTQLLIESNYFRTIQDVAITESDQELGNITREDRRKYIGRGYIKLRGRAQYELYSLSSKIDVLRYPHYVTTPKVAMDISGWIWDTRLLNVLSDKGDIEGITKILTGGYILLREREEILLRLTKILGNEF